MKNENKIICPICGEEMEKYDFDYNTIKDERMDFKCPNCGHKKTILL